MRANRLVLALVFALCVGSAGCVGPLVWKVTDASTETTMGTQFEVEWGTKIAVGFPGTVTTRVEGEAAGEREPEPPAP